MTFLYGLTLPLRAFFLIIRSPVLLLWSAAPVFIALVLDIFVILRVQRWVHDQISSYLGTEGFFAMAAIALAWLTLFIVSALTFSFVVTVIATPFNDFLAEKTESRATPPLPPSRVISLGVRARLIMIDLGKTLFGATLGVLDLFLSWVPGLNLVALVLGCWLICFQFLSYPQTRRGEGITSALRFIARNPLSCLGFGASISVLFSVPFLSAFALPLAVVGGTLLYAQGSKS